MDQEVDNPIFLFQAFILPVSKALGEISGLAINAKGQLIAFHRADREWEASSFDDKEVFNKKLGHIKNATIAVIDPSNGKLFVCVVAVYVYASTDDNIVHSSDEMGPSEFVIPHSLALIEDMNLICVADRENERVQCFSAGLAEGHRTIPAGIPITSAEQIGRVYAIREKKHYLVGVTGRDEEDQLPPQMFVMDMTNGKANTFIKGIENAHSLAISDEGTVFISQMHPNQIIQISLPEQA
ncbi:unnamed protein product [Nippostrongylus brasiliensis]|uniref:NHL repeat protein n=1 Tax=Nippostrongylus brasiliensis TaxID=27835 RepID=A0A0N4YHQ1_NIPBR|nr:unnamed protein product [Nippostrongylus brasiliensis]